MAEEDVMVVVWPKLSSWLVSMETERKCSATASISRTLRELPPEDIPQLRAAFCDNLLRIIPQEIVYKDVLRACNVLVGCFDNFPFGASVVESLFDQVIHFLLASMKFFQLPLTDEMSLENLTKQELVDIVHKCSRLLTLVLKLKRTAEATGRIEQYRDWSQLCTSLIRHASCLPIDTKINLAMALWLLKEIALTQQQLLTLHNNFVQSFDSVSPQGSKDVFIMAAGAIKLWTEPVIQASDTLRYLRLFIALCDTHLDDTQMLLMITRCLQTVCKNKTFVESDCDFGLASQLAETIFTLLENPVPCVRHSARDLVSTAVHITTVQPHIQRVVLSLYQQHQLRKSFFIALSALGAAVDVHSLISALPGLPDVLVHALQDSTIVSHVAAAIESVAQRDARAQSNMTDWCRVWVMPLLSSCCGGSAVDAEKLLLRLVKEHPDALTVSLEQWSEKEDISSRVKSQGVLICLKLRNKLQGDGVSLLQLVYLSQSNQNDFLKRCSEDGSDDVRLSILSLIAESLNPAPWHLSAAMHLLSHNLNNHRPATRQKFAALFKKLLIRVNVLWLGSRRAVEKKKLVEGMVPPDEYRSFVTALVEECYKNIFPGANFNRLSTVLTLLTCCQEVLDGALWHECGLHTANRWPSLMTALSSSYEENKMMAVALAVKLPLAQMHISEPDSLMLQFRRAFGLIQQLEPPSVLLGAYLLLILLHVPTARDVMKNRFCCGIHNPSSSINVLCIQVLARYLQLQLDDAQHSLMVAARQSPMYGTMFTIRLILKKLTVQDLALPECKQVLNDLVSTSFTLADVVSPVVNNSSPEGHLPMDFHAILQDGNDTPQLLERRVKVSDVDSMISDFKSVNSPELKMELAGHIRDALENQLEAMIAHDQVQPMMEESERWCAELRRKRQLLSEYDSYYKFFQGHLPRFIEDRHVTAQALLLMSWRTMKEAALYLGDLVSKAPLSCLRASEFITELAIEEIGLKLRQLLSEIKHRGAFEQAEIAFTQLCSALWKCPIRSLHALPARWLHEILSEMMLPSIEQKLKFTSTRRSAGLPFLVQAIVVSEVLSLNSSTADHFCDTMTKLLNVAEAADIDLEPRLHAYNILRALFRNAELGEFVAPFVMRGLELAIKGSRGCWPERNCANMLFSALVVRIFGVSRSKDQLSMKNRMTSRVFFQRYPQLHQVFLEELKQVGQPTRGVSPQPSLYLVLLLLGRLYPPGDGERCEIDMGSLVNQITACSGHGVHRIRVLAARALVPFIPAHLIVEELKYRLDELSGKKSLCNNVRHGLMLQVLELISESVKYPHLDEEINHLTVPAKWTLNYKTAGETHGAESGVPFLVLDVLAQIQLKLLRSYPNHATNKELLESTKWDWSFHTFSSLHREISVDSWLASSVLSKLESLSNSEDWVKMLPLLHCGVSTVENVLLQFLFCLLTPLSQRHLASLTLITDAIEEAPCLTDAKRREKLKEDIKRLVTWSKLVKMGWQGIQLATNLQQRRLVTVVTGKAMEKLEADNLQHDTDGIFELLPLYQHGWHGLPFPRQPLMRPTSYRLVYRRILTSMRAMEDSDVECRLAVAQVLAMAHHLLVPNSKHELCVELRLLWLLLLRLLSDEEESVRTAAQTVMHKLDGDSEEIIETPLAAQQRLLECYRRKMAVFDCNVNFELFLLTALSVVETIEEPQADDPLEIFKRGNPNPFCEAVALTRLLASRTQPFNDQENSDETTEQVLWHINVELAPHFARNGLKLQPLLSVKHLVSEVNRLPPSENAAGDVFMAHIREMIEISGCKLK